MQRLDGERHACLSRLRENFENGLLHRLARARQILRAGGEAAHDQHQALRAERVSFVDRAPIVIEPVFRSKEAAAAKPGYGQSVGLDGFHGLTQAHLRNLVAPRRDAANVVPCAAVDHLRKVPLLFHRRGVE